MLNSTKVVITLVLSSFSTLFVWSYHFIRHRHPRPPGFSPPSSDPRLPPTRPDDKPELLTTMKPAMPNVPRKAEDGSTIILEMSLNISEQNVIDLSTLATPERFRLVDCAALADVAHPILRIYEYDTFNLHRGDYSAISYIWRGNPPRPSTNPARAPAVTGTVVVEGARDGDPIGLAAMRHASLAVTNGSSRIKYMWLDRLCIMQTDDDDKSWQIQRMFDVYRRASLCLVLPGGLSRLVGLDEETEWMLRAWTLQEAVVPPVTEVLFSLSDLPVPVPPESERGALIMDRAHTYGLCSTTYIVPGASATVELRTLLRTIRVPSTNPRFEFFPRGISIPLVPRIFGATDTGAQRRELLALADAMDTIWTGENWSRYALWQSSFLRTSKRPVDMVFSIMGFFGVSLDPRRFRSGDGRKDRIAVTIALAQELLRRGGQAEWLTAGWNEPPDHRLSFFPELPETSVSAPPTFMSPRSDVSREVDGANLDIRIRFSRQTVEVPAVVVYVYLPYDSLDGVEFRNGLKYNRAGRRQCVGGYLAGAPSLKEGGYGVPFVPAQQTRPNRGIQQILQVTFP